MNRIKELRLKRNLTLKDLSNEINTNYDTSVSDGQLSNYENEKRTPRDSKFWENLADYFNVSVAYIMGLSESKVDEKKSLEIARQTYQKLLVQDLSEHELKTLEYFNNENLDNNLAIVMERYFSISYVKEHPHLSNLILTTYLEKIMLYELTDIYMKQVKTNQNLIFDIYNSLETKSFLASFYNKVESFNIPFKDVYFSLFKDCDESQLTTDNTKIDTSNADILVDIIDTSINEDLQTEIEDILYEAQRKIKDLKEKYPDEPSSLELDIMFHALTDDGYLTNHWNQKGSNEIIDELNLKDEVKSKIIDHLSKKYL